MKSIIYLFMLIVFSVTANAQGYLLGPQQFNSDIVVHGTTAPTTSWFAPNYNTPVDFIASGGCTGSCVGYSGSWNNYWGNFLRLPQVNCSGYDTILMTFDISNSYFATQSADWCRFYIWADNGYKNNVISVKIDGIDVTYDSGANGKGFKFSEARNCASVQVLFNISAIADKSNILFYLEPSCGYNNSNTFMVKFDNIAVTGGSTVTVVENNTISKEHENIVISVSENSVTFSAVQNINSIKLFSISGIPVYSRENINNIVFCLNNRSFLNGTYIIQINCNGKLYNKKIEILK